MKWNKIVLVAKTILFHFRRTRNHGIYKLTPSNILAIPETREVLREGQEVVPQSAAKRNSSVYLDICVT